MKLHTDRLDSFEVLAMLDKAGLSDEGVWADTCTPKGSRSRKRAFDVHLSATPGKDRFGKARRAPQTPNGARAATYDEWGLFIAQVFRLDPDAIFGPYKGRDHFNELTRFNYAERTTA